MNILNQPPHHGLIHDFLGNKMIADLLKFAQSNQHLFEDSKVGYKENARIDKSQRVSHVLREIGDFHSQLEVKLNEIKPFIFERLKSKPFIPFKYEIEMVAHGDGAFFGRHTDTIIQVNSSKSRRIISAVYYFHTLPKTFSGGTLRIHSLGRSGQQGTFLDIEPLRDTLVFFPSWFPHEVLPVNCPNKDFMNSRFAINIWIHEGCNTSS